MGYVDSATMIEFKDKILDKIKQNGKDHHVCCRLSLFGQADSETDFQDHKFLERQPELDMTVKYCLAVGNSSYNYLKRRNGNGFIPDVNDYLHHRKTYLDCNSFYLAKPYISYADFLKQFFGAAYYQQIFVDGPSTWGTENLHNDSRFSAKPIHGFRIILPDVDYDDFFEDIKDSEYYRCMLSHIPTPEPETGRWTRLRAKTYFVKNPFIRPHPEGQMEPKFCEAVVGYIHFTVSVNEEENGISISFFQLFDRY